MKPKSIYLDAGNDELKILFIVPENPKKAIYATAILEKIFTLHPRAKITILGKMPAVSLFGATPNTDKILIVEKAYYLDAIKKVLSSMKSRNASEEEIQMVLDLLNEYEEVLKKKKINRVTDATHSDVGTER